MSAARSLSAALFAIAAVAACEAPDANKVTTVQAPDYDQFKGAAVDGALQPGSVSRLLERRCATLDCHGQVGRPLRIYGQYGLRLEQDGSIRPGVDPTTEAEFQANYDAAIALQPEMMSLVASGAEAPEGLLLLRKPLGLERHKGGVVFESGDDAYACITSWLAGHISFTACSKALQ